MADISASCRATMYLPAGRSVPTAVCVWTVMSLKTMSGAAITTAVSAVRA